MQKKEEPRRRENTPQGSCRSAWMRGRFGAEPVLRLGQGFEDRTVREALLQVCTSLVVRLGRPRWHAGGVENDCRPLRSVVEAHCGLEQGVEGEPSLLRHGVGEHV